MNKVVYIKDFLQKKGKEVEQEMLKNPQNTEIFDRMWNIRISLEKINKLMQELKEQGEIKQWLRLKEDFGNK